MLGWKAIRLLVVYLLRIGVQAITPTSSLGANQDKPQRCTFHRAYGMQGAHCSNLNLHGVPGTLKTNIQILDVSLNRIRILRNTTFTRYTSLRYLYMADNMIQTIEAGTFEPVPYLETLDLSINALITIPEFILNLPSLRRLYLADNGLINLSNDLKSMAKPFQAPISFLSIAKCQLKDLPDFGMMPELEHFNVSSNELRNLSPTNFASYCGLKQLDLTNAMYVQDYCTYKVLSEWFKQKEVTVQPDIDTIFSPDNEDGKKCTDIQFSEEDVNQYMECKSTIKTRVFERNAKKTWMIIAASIGGCLVAFAVILYIAHRRNVKKTTRTNKVAADKRDTVIENLLNDKS